MKLTSSKNVTVIVSLMLYILFTSGYAAAGSCENKADALQDMQQFAKKIADDIEGEIPKVLKVNFSSETAGILDHKFHKIDRSLPGFDQLNSVGIITGKPFSNSIQSYGSAVLISPCHVLTNRHVVAEAASGRGESLRIGTNVYFSVGQQKSCDSKQQFGAQNLVGSVVDYGINESNDHDWAIVKLKTKASVSPAELSGAPLTVGRLGVMAGYPHSEIKDQFGFEYLRAQYVKAINAKVTGLVGVSDTTFRPGLSGGGNFVLDSVDGSTLEAKLVGISVSAGGNTLSIKSIFSKMHANKKGTPADIKKAIETGICE